MYTKLILLISGLTSLFVSEIYAQTLKDGIRHMELEQYESSKNIFRSLIKKDPKNPEYYYELGEVYLKSEVPDSAKYFFQEGIKVKEGFALNYVGMGKVISEKSEAEAKKNFDKSLELSKSKDARVLADVADYFINCPVPDLNRAIELLEKAIKLDSKDPKYYLLMGDAYLEKGDGSKAMANYNKGFEIDKSWPYPYLKIGKLYAKARNYNLAVDYYNKGLGIDPNYGPLYREIGEVYYKAKMYNKAIASYKKYVELSDKSFDTDLRYASFLYFNQDFRNAISILDNLVKKDSRNYIVNRLLAYSYYETGDYNKGLNIMENFWKSLNGQKLLTSDYEYYGKLLLKNNNDSLAILNLRKAIEMDTSKSELYGEIGNVYFLNKKYGEAANAYSLKMERVKPTAQDYLILGKAYYYDKKYSLADSVFTKLVSLADSSPTGYLWRARANAYLDEDLSQGLAKPYYEKYIELIKPDATKYKRELVEAYSSIGAYYMKRKDKPNADFAWKMIKELDPSNTSVDGYLKSNY